MRRRLTSLVIVVVLAAAAAPLAAQNAQSPNAIQEEIEDTRQQVDELLGMIEAAEVRESETRTLLLDKRAQVDAAQAELTQAEGNLAVIEDRMARNQRQIDRTIRRIVDQQALLEETRGEIDATTGKVRVQAVDMYMRGDSSGVSISLNIVNAEELTVGREYVTQLVNETERLLDELQVLERQEEAQLKSIEDEQDKLEGRRAKLEDDQEEAEKVRAEVADREQTLQMELAWQQAELQSILNEIALFEDEILAQEAEEGRLLELLASSQQAAGVPPGELWWPADGPLTSPFGTRLHPILGYARLHAGIDISAPSGTPIWAASTGTVILAGWYGGYGNAVIIDHGGGLATLYAHQSSIAVSNGQQVGVGEVIGYVGSTGLSTGPHLHFEVRQNGTPIDPMQYFS